MTVKNSWNRLDPYRDEFVKGEWPTITEQFRLAAHLYPEAPAFTQFSPEEIRIPYKEAREYVCRIASWLVSKGFKKGDRAVLIGKNSPWWAISYLSVLEAGGVIVPLDVQMEDETAQRLISFTEAQFLFADGDKHEILGGNDSGVRHKVSLSRDVGTFLLDLPAGKSTEFDQAEENDLAAILFTSGTTGLEKGVMLTHKNFMTDVYQACHPDFLQAEQSDVWYALLPLHHSYCMTAVFLEGITHASEIIFAGGLSVGQMMKDLELGGVTIFMGIPLLYNKILKGMMKQVRAKGLASHLLVGLLMRISGSVQNGVQSEYREKDIRKYSFEKGEFVQSEISDFRWGTSGAGNCQTLSGTGTGFRPGLWNDRDGPDFHPESRPRIQNQSGGQGVPPHRDVHHQSG
jgi:long-chain acyl-CoA synthetase